MSSERGPIAERGVERLDSVAATRRADRDRLVVEAPLELRAGGRSIVVLMRTPGDDEDLARGLLLAEGVTAAGAPPPVLHRPPGLTAEEEGNVLETGLDPDAVHAAMGARTLHATASCGVCGKAAIAALEVRATAVRSDLQVSAALIAGLPGRLRAAQAVFAATGGLHAAGLFTDGGEPLAVREDVGRHNAVDKLLGWAHAGGRLPLADAILCVSGRLGYEIVQKAVVAGVPIVAAVSAPSSLAVDLAERFRVTLCGFVRGPTLNVYSHPARVL